MSEIVLTTFDISRKHHLLALKERMDKDISRLESIIAGLEHSGGTYPLAGLWNFFTIHPWRTDIISWPLEKGS